MSLSWQQRVIEHRLLQYRTHRCVQSRRPDRNVRQTRHRTVRPDKCHGEFRAGRRTSNRPFRAMCRRFVTARTVTCRGGTDRTVLPIGNAFAASHTAVLNQGDCRIM